MQFRYKSVSSPEGKSIRRPSIPITFIGPSESIDAIALIDSGADISLIPKEMAEVLGLDTAGEFKWAYGVGGKVRTVERHLRLKIGRDHETYTLDLPVKVIIDGYDLSPLLGRKGFFEHFEITFSEAQEKIWLKHAAPRVKSRKS